MQMTQNLKNQMLFMRLSFILTVVAVLLLSNTAKADIAYTFIKMTCDPDAKSATISVIYDQNEAGKARSERHEKDIYPLGERLGPITKKEGTCDLGGGQKIAFAAYQGELPKKDGLILFINGKDITDHTLGYGEWTTDVQLVENNTYIIKYCPEFADGTFVQDIEAFYKSKQCRVSRVVDGKVQKSETVTR
jgi:hypothetical protein